MKNLTSIILEKYQDINNYQMIENNGIFIYMNKHNEKYYTAFSCELENDETVNYPLDDILDKYYLNCVSIELHYPNFIFEVEYSNGNGLVNLEGLKKVQEINNKSVFLEKLDDKFRLRIK